MPRSPASHDRRLPLVEFPLELPKRVVVHEVGPRDGFQLEKSMIPTAIKIQIINGLAKTGLSKIQATSFVRPSAVPQLRDADDVMATVTRREGVKYSVLVPNLRGANRALSHSADIWETMLSVSDSHSMANANRKTNEALSELRDVVALARQEHVEVVGGMATALGCPFEGRVPYDRVCSVVAAYCDMGVKSITIADTAGMADPSQVYSMCSNLRSDFPKPSFTLHLHNTRGMGLANVLSGMFAGITEFDSSIGGLGGCPYAPGATGNIATEDLVHMLKLMGISTGVELKRLLDVARDLVAPHIDHQLESALSRTDPSWILHRLPNTAELTKSPLRQAQGEDAGPLRYENSTN